MRWLSFAGALLVLFVTTAKAAGDAAQDNAILVDFYDALTFDQQNARAWDTLSSICGQVGVFCDGSSRVSSLTLVGNAIPASFINLTRVEMFSYTQDTAGPLPNLSGWEVVSSIDIKGSFSGSIPTTLGSLSTLSFLRLMSSGLTQGPIPTEFELLTLDTLIIRGNSTFGGPIPEWPFGSRYITNLGLYSMGLTGTIPEVSSNIVYLQLKGNALSGTLPSSIFHAGAINVDISGNPNITGCVPSEVSTATDLETLFLDGTQVCSTCGTIGLLVDYTLGTCSTSTVTVTVTTTPAPTPTSCDTIKTNFRNGGCCPGCTT